MSPVRPLPTVAVLALAVLLAGCLSLSVGDTDPDPEALLGEVAESHGDVEAIEAVRTTELERDGNRVSWTQRVLERPPDAVRAELLESTDPDRTPGDLSATNDSHAWTYDAEADVAEVRLRDERGLRPTPEDPRGTYEELLGGYELSYEGTEELEGGVAHVVEATEPTNETVERSVGLLVGDTAYVLPIETDLEDAEVSRTVWIDDELRYPVREHVEIERPEGPNGSVTRSYEELTVDPELDEEPFEPPADAEVVDLGPDRHDRFDSLEATDDAVDLDLPEPPVDEGYAFDGAVVREDREETTVSLWYVEEGETDRQLYVELTESDRNLIRADWEETTVGEQDGLVGESHGFDFFAWECADVGYEVGHSTDRDVAEDVAAELGCR